MHITCCKPTTLHATWPPLGRALLKGLTASPRRSAISCMSQPGLTPQDKKVTALSCVAARTTLHTHGDNVFTYLLSYLSALSLKVLRGLPAKRIRRGFSFVCDGDNVQETLAERHYMRFGSYACIEGSLSLYFRGLSRC